MSSFFLYRNPLIYMDNPFQWDGTHLGILKGDNILSEEICREAHGMRLWHIKLNGYYTYILVKEIKGSLSPILDEFKECLGIDKIGCHTFRYKGTKRIGYFAYPDIYKINELYLPESKEDIKLLLAFREIFGLSSSFVGYMRMCYWDERWFPVSFRETSIVSDTLASVISKKDEEEYFREKTSIDTIMELLCFNRESPEITLTYYRKILEGIIQRVDPEALWIVDLFIERLSHLLGI